MKAHLKAAGYFLMFFLFTLIFSCSSDDDQTTAPEDLSFNFTTDAEGWTGDFADYPAGEEDSYELDFAYSKLPSPLDSSDGALKLSGNNHSDDLFMFVKKKITGLAPNITYNLTFEIEIATNAPQSSVGIGGSPGTSVFLKAGAVTNEPLAEANDEDFIEINIDKGYQSEEGDDMKVLGNLSNGTDEAVYHLKNFTGEDFSVKTANDGSFWVIIGTDSGFEGTTTFYISQVQLQFE